MRGRGSGVPDALVRSATRANVRTSSSYAGSGRPLMTYRAPIVPATSWTLAPVASFHARLIGAKRVVLCGIHGKVRPRAGHPSRRRHDGRSVRIRVEADPRHAVERRGILRRSGVVGYRFPLGIRRWAQQFQTRAHLVGQRRGGCDDAHAHLKWQRPPRRIVRTMGRTTRVLAHVRIVLHVEHLAGHRRELLIRRHDPRARRKRLAAHHRRRRQLRDAHATKGEPPQQLHGRDRITLLLRDEVSKRRFASTAGNLIATGHVAIEEQRLPVLRRVFEHGQRCRVHVGDRVSKPPPAGTPRARVEALRPEVTKALGEVGDRVLARRRILEERRLGPERRHILEVRRVVDVAGIPRVERRPHVRGADLSALLEALRDSHADHVDLARHQKRRVAADRLRERRQPDARRKRRRLVVHVDDVRLPVAPGLLDDPRLDHVQHVGVAVVVVADVLLIELRQSGQLIRRPDVRHVPFAHHLLAVGIDRRPQHQNHVVEDRLGRRLVGLRPADEVVRELRRVLRAGDFGRMQTAVDVDNRLAFAGELTRRRVGQPRRMRQPLCNLPIALDLIEVLRVRDEREVHRAPLARLAAFDEADVLARGRELPEIVDRLIVGRELVVGAGLETKRRVRRGKEARLCRQHDRRRKHPDQDHTCRRLHRNPRMATTALGFWLWALVRALRFEFEHRAFSKSQEPKAESHHY